MTVIYAAPVSTVDPDSPDERALIAPERLAVLDRRSGPARAQGFSAQLLLEYAVAKHFPAAVHPLSIAVKDGGKPYLLTQPDVHFSLSHSGAWAVCALSDVAVGVDIERRTPGRRKIAERFFHKKEAAYLDQLPSHAREDAFYSLWVLKESFVKATGRGLHLPLRSFCIDLQADPPRLDCSEVDGAFSLSLLPFPADPAYRLAVCTAAPNAPTPTLTVLN